MFSFTVKFKAFPFTYFCVKCSFKQSLFNPINTLPPPLFFHFIQQLGYLHIFRPSFVGEIRTLMLPLDAGP